MMFASSENNYMTTNNLRIVANVAVASAAHLAGLQTVERLGSLIRRDDYVRPAFRTANVAIVGTSDQNRTAFMVRLDDGIGGEFVTIDQVADAESSILEIGDQVIVTFVDDVHVEDTIRGTFRFDAIDKIDQETLDRGQTLRQAQYRNGKNELCNVTLALIGAGSTTQMICVEQIAA